MWYPDGEGPFPIVLMVHGNHQAEDFSDPGYEYLGRLFASRGTIAVSVDENFLNGTASDLLRFPDGGMSEENDARGWLLLEHLRQWREWNRTPGNPFERHVDLERVALVGHSRGGEAVAVAGAFNRLPFYPDDARVAFDYGFGIRGVAAIAPVDGQYKPAGAPTRLSNLSYFVLHGSHDGDMQSFHGERVFERVRFTDGAEHFKAGLYVHRANHGQFNTTWGRGNSGGLGNRFLNLRPLLPKEDQERVARVFLSTFVEATVRSEVGYRALFRDYRRGARPGCPASSTCSSTRTPPPASWPTTRRTSQVPKAAWLSDEKPSELVFDAFEMPLSAFREATPGLDPSRLRAVRFIFDRTVKGVIVLDDLAIR